MLFRFYLYILFLLFIQLMAFSANGQAVEEDPDYTTFEEFWSIGTVNSLVIEQGNDIIFEQYTEGMTASRPTNTKSASKSILSLLVGIAIEEGYLEGTGQTIKEFFPDYFEANPDPVKESITLEDMLTMRSGLETTSRWNYGPWVTSSNWVKFALDQPFEDEPGGRMIYSTGTSHLLSVILTKATGMNTRDFANRYLFAPMDIRVGGWDRDPQGYYMGGNNLALSPESLLKIGRMVMGLGVYNEQQIVPPEWIIRSMQKYTKSRANPYDYGYMWWRKKVSGYEVAFAWGNGGQYIMMLPELDSVVVITSDADRNNGSRLYQNRIFNFLEGKIIPFLESR